MSIKASECVFVSEAQWTNSMIPAPINPPLQIPITTTTTSYCAPYTTSREAFPELKNSHPGRFQSVQYYNPQWIISIFPALLLPVGEVAHLCVYATRCYPGRRRLWTWPQFTASGIGKANLHDQLGHESREYSLRFKINQSRIKIWHILIQRIRIYLFY